VTWRNKIRGNINRGNKIRGNVTQVNEISEECNFEEMRYRGNGIS
jgi:hypothetical protein